MRREEIATLILQRMRDHRSDLRAQFERSAPAIGHFVLDDVLPDSLAQQVAAAFPRAQDMTLNSSLRERKYIAAQMNRYAPLLEEALFAFQDPRILAEMEEITGLKGLEADPALYAGGLSLMTQHQFLNPHVDNSHDKDRERWRVLNALYYVSPGWADDNGGHLELWPSGVQGPPVTLHSRFNRLVVMATHAGSWHSVCPVRVDGSRRCVSNYYFRRTPARESDQFHVTAFRGRPEEPLRDLALRADAALRMLVRRVFRKGVRKVTHLYER